MKILLSKLLLNVQLPSKPFFRGHVFGGRSSVYWDSPRTLDAAALGGAERRAFFSSDAEAQYREELPTEVVALPLTDTPLFLGPIQLIMVKDPTLVDFLIHKQPEYVAAFLIKDERENNPIASYTEAGCKYDLKGKLLYDHLHSVGTVAEVAGFRDIPDSRSIQLSLRGCGRIRKLNMLCEDPLTVEVDHLKDKPFDKDDDVIRETSYEILTALSKIGNLRSQWIYRTLIKCIIENNVPSLAYFGAAISGDPEMQSQRVLEEQDVRQRLEVVLTLVKRELKQAKDTIECEYGWLEIDDKRRISEQLSMHLQQISEAAEGKKSANEEEL